MMIEKYSLVVVVFIVIFLSFVLYTALRTEKLVVEINGKRINVEVFDNIITRQKGLMFREYLEEDEGALFVFEKEGFYSFWMMNTKIPLDAIFVDSNFTVVDIIEMEPCKLFPCKTYTSDKPAKYVIEVNRGFSRKYSVSIGNRISIQNKLDQDIE